MRLPQTGVFCQHFVAMRGNVGNSKELLLPVLVCFAVKEEAKHFLALRSADRERIKVVITGMGRANAALSFGMALLDHHPAMVVTAGFAGGLNPKLAAGQVVFDAETKTGLERRLKGAGAVAGEFHCAGQVAVSAAEKAELRKSTKADAVEMESGTIRKLCQMANIPSATVRVISDAANEDLPLNFNALMTADQRISYARLVWAVAKSPRKIPDLMRFQKRADAAARKLAEVLWESLKQ